ncbi:GPW/gp25 family protein [Aliiroseovarius crassostreae]|uniref:GPW/gp25 family protein n=1 Tax=Aliiroseovarius crassostreae TaxID=154981 RepID=UPI00220A7D89|nr:GPW/gp25 family protein [Aliiroseovarius crassostreae]UWQ00854.1 GPW/gp25 family protein [Aliiroseovarius crassostreae]
MSGMNRHTGRKIEGDAHLAQSVHDILATPKGSLVMLRDYGSDLPDIIDQPMNGETMVDVFQATAEALDQWEPRIDLARVQVAEAHAGYVALELHDVEGNMIPMPIDLKAGAAQ